MSHTTRAAGGLRGLTRSSAQLGILVLLALGSTATAKVPLIGAQEAAADPPAVVDLGTLGGATSKAVALNEVGQVAGDAATSDGATHAFRWARGHMTDLGTLGGRDSHAAAINAAGDIAGYAQTSAGAWRAVLWPARGDGTDLGTLGGAYSSAADLNDLGEVVGTAERADGTRVAFRWTAADGMHDLGTLGGTESNAQSINALGQIAGTSTREDGYRHAFRWTAATGMQDLGTLGGPFSGAVAINALGQVAGSSMTEPEGGDPWVFPFRWSADEGMRLLQTNPSYAVAYAVAMSDAGDVVGWGNTGLNYGPQEAWRWTPNGAVALEQTGYADDIYWPNNEATDINVDGITVGSVTTTTYAQRATRWAADGQVEYLPTLGGTNSRAVAVNGVGLVAGESQTTGGATHAALWR
jgi:probable HAF family extracellular repeat protein